MKVLFCGNHFSGGFCYTQNAIRELLGGGGNGDGDEIIAVQCEREDIPLHLANVDVIVPLMTKITAELIDQAPSLKLIMQYGIGLEGVDIPAATTRSIYVCNIPSEGCGNAQSCAELCIFHAMSLLRNINALRESIVQGRLGLPIGRTIFGTSAMIIGYGGMGRQLLPRLLILGIQHVVIVVRTVREEDTATIASNNVTWCTFDEFQNAPGNTFSVDLCFLCCSVNDSNRGFVNKQFFARFRPGFHLVNVARGGLINYGDLAEALDSDALAGAGLDVFHTEPFPSTDALLSHPKVVVTPHVGGVTEISYQNMAKLVAENVLRVHRGERPVGIVNGL